MKIPSLLQGLLRCLEESKAENIQIYDVGDYVSYSDHVIILTALSGSHVKALINRTEAYFKELKIEPFKHTRKHDNYQWVVLDYHATIIHFFKLRKGLSIN